MTIEERITNDKAIAYFSGWRIDNNFPDKGRVWKKGSYLEIDTTFKFSIDWNILQEIVEQIEDLGFNFHTHQARVLIQLNDSGLIVGMSNPEIEVLISMVDFDKKMATYKAVAQFAMWYNNLELRKRSGKEN